MGVSRSEEFMLFISAGEMPLRVYHNSWQSKMVMNEQPTEYEICYDTFRANLSLHFVMTSPADDTRLKICVYVKFYAKFPKILPKRFSWTKGQTRALNVGRKNCSRRNDQTPVSNFAYAIFVD